MITNALRSRLRQIVSDEYVLDDEAHLALYGSDGSGKYAPPGLVVLPGSEEEVAAVLTVLADAGVPVTVRGAASGVAGGAVPTPDGVVLAMARLHEPVHLLPDERLITAPAGARMHDVERLALREGLWFGDPIPAYPYGTVGGLVARNGNGLGGPMGTVHGIVRGIRAVLPDGHPIASDGEGMHGVHAHAAGMLIGSEGALGVVTGATFALKPRIPAHRIIVATFDDVLTAAQAGAEMIAAGACPLLADAVDRATWTRVATWPGDDRTEGLLLVWLSGLEEEVHDEAAWVISICKDFMAEVASSLEDDEHARYTSAWGHVLRMSYPAPHHLPLDLAVPVSRLPELLEAVHERSYQRNVPVAGIARVTDGLLAMRVPVVSHKEEWTRRAARFVEEIAECVQEMHGTPLALHGVGSKRVEMLHTVHYPADLNAARLLKRAFDPHGILAVNCTPSHAEQKPGNPATFRAQDALNRKVAQIVADGEASAVLVRDPQELARLVRSAGEHNVPLAVHDYPEGRLLDICLSEMHQIVSLDADSRLIAVEGGISLGDLQEHVRTAGLWLPISPLISPETPLSDCLAWHRADARSLGWGPLFARVTGLEAVTGRGEVVSWGGLVPMHHGGLRLSELCLGTRHRYAVITAVAMTLVPMPSARAVLVARFADVDHADAAVRRWLGPSTDAHTQCRPSAICIMLEGSSQEAHVLTEFVGLPPSVERQLEHATHLASEEGAHEAYPVFDEEAQMQWNRAREIYCQRPSAAEKDVLRIVIWTSHARWVELARAVRDLSAAHHCTCRMLADMGCGRLDVAITGDVADPASLIDALRAPVLRADAWMEVWSSSLAGGWIGKHSPAMERVLAALKAMFDPKGVLPAGWGEPIGNASETRAARTTTAKRY